MGKKAILNKLVEAEGFERFIDVKYTGTKRFGLDGGESVVPALEQIIKRGGNLGVREIVLGMAHRGRLNVLAQVMGKPHRAIFHEFKGGSSSPDDVEGSGDVKYHLGASSDREFDGNKVHLSLTANPSHLEIVDPVVLGKARAKQNQHADKPRGDIVPLEQRARVLPLLIHGDAAFAGQGVVAECMGLSGLRGHRTAGSIHFIINNQIGFTTNPRFGAFLALSLRHRQDGRGADPARQWRRSGSGRLRRQGRHRIPPEVPQAGGHRHVLLPALRPQRRRRAVLHPAADVQDDRQPSDDAGDLRQEARRGRPGHARTRSRRTRPIGGRRSKPSSRRAPNYRANKADWLDGAWSGLKVAETGDGPRRGATAVPLETLREVGGKLTDAAGGLPGPPHHPALHRQPQEFDRDRPQHRLVDGRGAGLRHAAGRRQSGPPVGPGRRARHLLAAPFGALRPGERRAATSRSTTSSNEQARFEVINSMLSEEAVLGFEYGYSLAEPAALIMWEAQFGDFANGAQVVIDQFISSGEKKWLRMSGLVMLLPHGYEGQGPEHSSARLERYLQLCAEDNIQVANLTTPANYFHALRRQLQRDFRKPLVLMTPKSLLRHKRAVSRLDEMGPGSSFHRLLWDDAEILKGEKIKLQPDEKIRRVILCSGKVYYDLYEERETRGIDDIYLLRIEQLYPFPAKALITELSRFRQADMVWCQEEPKNMGAWSFVEPYLEWVLESIGAERRQPRYVGRPASAATATGLMSKHLAQLGAFLDEALAE